MVPLRGQRKELGIGKTKRGKDTMIMAIADRNGLPLAVKITRTSTYEGTLVESYLEHHVIKKPPKLLFCDKAYNSDSFDQRHYDNKGIMSIASHKYNLIQPQPQDVRVLRRYRRRWKVEQLFAWFHYIRRLIVRYEYHIENFFVMVLLGCIIILLKHF